MKNESNIPNIKQLKNFRFKDIGKIYAVYMQINEAYFFLCKIEKKSKESNQALYNRAKKISKMIVI